jgi:ribonuclease BN (tRNA processing enzyme)
VTRRLVVLGSCGARPEAGRASSGFLVEYDGVRIVLDLGYGTLPRLLSHVPDADLDAVVITHEHADHCVDLHALYRVLRFGPVRSRIPLFAPPGVLERVGALEVDGDLRDAFDVREFPATVGPFRMSSVQLPHWVPNSGVRLAAAGFVLAYTGDAGPSPEAVALGEDADLFVVEATLQGGDESPYLRNARQAGKLASAAGARRLMLTHFWPDSDRSVSRAEAAEAFAGEILVASEDLVVTLG